MMARTKAMARAWGRGEGDWFEIQGEGDKGRGEGGKEKGGWGFGEKVGKRESKRW